jgi:hypothetical protein
LYFICGERDGRAGKNELPRNRIYEKCCQPWGVRRTAPSGVIRVMGEARDELAGFADRSLAGTIRPMEVTATPSMLDGMRAAGGAVKRSS